MSKFYLKAFSLIFLLFTVLYVRAAEPVSTGLLNNVAIGKHSPFAYHRQEQAVKGDKKYSYEWKGADWYFSSAQERDLFAAMPDLYAPAYNGFCANALSLGEGLVRTNGSHWRIIEGNLYLFYSASGRERWAVNTETHIKAANEAWQEDLRKRN